jgi:predicted PurR-regulated permease PerM
MSARNESRSRSHGFERAVLIFGTVAAMYFMAEVLKPLALSVLLSFALSPAARRFEQLGLPRAMSVVFTVVIALGFLGGVGYIVGDQLTALVKRLPDYQDNIETKLNRVLRPEYRATSNRLQVMVDRVTSKLEAPHAHGPDDSAPIQKVEVVEQPSIHDRLRFFSGPYLEYLGVGGFVLVLVSFVLVNREDLSARLVALFGHRHVSLASRTMDEIGQRISRYLATFAIVNSGFGLVIGLGLGLIGVPFAVLLGCLAAMLRFIPYVGPAVAFGIPLIFSFAHFPGWREPIEVVVLFGVVEALLNSFLEPVIYGRTTGVSALSLLIAAMFWTWLWGTLGLLLSTPLTVCIAVLGKYVRELRFLATLLGEDVELEPDVRFYQRLIALDREGAIAVVESALDERPRVEVFDRILIPALSRAERDVSRSEVDETERTFVWQVIGEVLDRLEAEADLQPTKATDSGRDQTAANDHDSGTPRATIVGIAVSDDADALVLRMLRQLLASSGHLLEVIGAGESPLHKAEQVSELSPSLVVLSHLPPTGLTLSRYMVRRLHAHCGRLPIIVGRWGTNRGGATAAEQLIGVGASRVVFSLAEARERIARLATHDPKPTGLPAPVTA